LSSELIKIFEFMNSFQKHSILVNSERRKDGRRKEKGSSE